MRVLHLTTEFPPIVYGGLGTATGGLVNALAQAGIDVAVLLIGPNAGSSYGEFRPLHGPGGRARKRRQHGVTIFEVSWFQDISELILIVSAWRPDVLHLHSFWIWHIAQAIRQRLGIPLVYTVHSLDRAEYELGQGPPQCIGQWADQEAVIYGADRVISLTRSERELLNQYCPGIGGRVRVVGNGIEEASDERRPKPPGAEGVTVLFAGRFVERKGIRELMEAIGIVLAEAPSVRFILAGGHRDCSGAQMEAWLLPASLYGQRAQIHFTGWLSQEQMADCYRAADILVVPSWYEPFGMVVLEGMMYGLAVAASCVGGPAEILDHGRTGLLFPPGDASALAQSILDLVRDQSYRIRLAAAAFRELQQHWLWPCIVDKMRGVYAELSA
jgi:glycosyltransferase involved in cell wall biosynthesis